jgi:hypothetical protein
MNALYEHHMDSIRFDINRSKATSELPLERRVYSPRARERALIMTQRSSANLWRRPSALACKHSVDRESTRTIRPVSFRQKIRSSQFHRTQLRSTWSALVSGAWRVRTFLVTY